MTSGGEYFRAGVGAVVVDGLGNVLALERADIPGAWQLPQGGLLAGEQPRHAVLREVAEETGIVASDMELLAGYPEPLAYELPAEMRSPKTGRGQVQYWFLFRYRGNPADLQLPEGGEFRSWRWQPFERILEEVGEFRRPLYRKLLAEFESHLHANRP